VRSGTHDPAHPLYVYGGVPHLKTGRWPEVGIDMRAPASGAGKLAVAGIPP